MREGSESGTRVMVARDTEARNQNSHQLRRTASADHLAQVAILKASLRERGIEHARVRGAIDTV